MLHRNETSHFILLKDDNISIFQALQQMIQVIREFVELWFQQWLNITLTLLYNRSMLHPHVC